MNDVAQARPRTWTPHLILFSVVLHAVVIYYVAVAFEIVPPLIPTTADPPTIRVFTPPPPPPPPPDNERLVQPKPIFNQRIPAPAPPVPSPVEPSPLTPTTNVPPGPPTVLVGQPIAEQPVAQALPRYPTVAEARGIEGRVTLSITIMPDGSVRDVRVVNANPRGYFEDAAVRAVQRWRYRPSNVTRTNVIVQMDFELKDA